MFKALGLLDDNGQPLQRYYEFLDQTQTGRIIAIGIEEAYEDLFNLRKDAQNLTNDEVKNKLKTITQGQKSDKILGLMAMTFRAFCDLADWDSVGTEETNKIKWHTHRGTSMINYVDFADLANIMGQNYDLFPLHRRGGNVACRK